MPKAKTLTKPKPAVPVAPTPPAKPQPVVAPVSIKPDLPVLYDHLTIEEYSTASEKGPLDVEWCKDALGWETEKEFQARKMKEVPGSKPEVWVFGDVFHCKDVSGQKVRTNCNANNRPFDEGWCEELIHTVLHGQWAGPHTIPGETVNGETIRISRYGRVLSGQHSMTGCILADEWLHKSRAEIGLDAANAKFPTWANHNHVFIETVVIKGMSEDPRVLMTVDYVKPRSVADVFYTSDVFRDSNPTERKELCRMLALATDLLWTRTDAQGYRTHPEVVGFLERHKRLLECVTHIHQENRAEKIIVKLRLSPGQCSALCYLMSAAGTSDEDSDAYRNMEPPTEKGIDFSLQDRAQDFWTLLGSGPDFLPVRLALGKLVDSDPTSADNLGLGGRMSEKMAILAGAWERFRDHPAAAGPPFSNDDLGPDGCLCPTYSDLDDQGNKLPDGQIKLLDVPDFHGIDCPEVVVKSGKRGRSGTPLPPPPTKEEIERATEEALKRRAQANAGAGKK